MSAPPHPSQPTAGVLVANGPWRWCQKTAAAAADAGILLAADGGANHLAEIGLRPQRVIGDLDSISPETRAWLGEERLLHRPDQSSTDLEKALDHALDELAVERLEVFGALGGRVDHLVSNLGLLARRSRGDRLVFHGDRELMVALRGELELPAEPGETWSFWSFDPTVRVSLEGVRWPLHEHPLDPVTGPSISNLAAGSRVLVRATGGAVLVLRRLLS